MVNAIKDHPIPLILKKIATDKISGELNLKDENHSRTLFFKNGNLYHAQTDVEEERIGEILVKQGKIEDKNVKFLAFGGDGGTYDIGFQALSGAMERGHDMMYVCYDNGAYMNTGIQRSSSTPYGASTTTSPAGSKSIGQNTKKKNLPAIVAAHEIPYVATASPSFPFDLLKKVEKAKKVNGPSYLHVLAVCPTGWRCGADTTIEMGRLAVRTGIFPLYEIENGKLTLNVDTPQLKPVEDYLKAQGRFRHLSPEDIAQIQESVTAEYTALKEQIC